ncbi:MAG TPA: hypothetical protein QF353_02760 [Gammaproteobacteria bacterium]|nr:hypothetical protein [Gammaproteobacteria bacterium]
MMGYKKYMLAFVLLVSPLSFASAKDCDSFHGKTSDCDRIGDELYEEYIERSCPVFDSLSEDEGWLSDPDKLDEMIALMIKHTDYDYELAKKKVIETCKKYDSSLDSVKNNPKELESECMKKFKMISRPEWHTLDRKTSRVDMMKVLNYKRQQELTKHEKSQQYRIAYDVYDNKNILSLNRWLMALFWMDHPHHTGKSPSSLKPSIFMMNDVDFESFEYFISAPNGYIPCANPGEGQSLMECSDIKQHEEHWSYLILWKKIIR